MTADPHGWLRLHPLSPVVTAGRVLAPLAVAFLVTRNGGSAHTQKYVDLALIVVLLLVSRVRWLVTRWRLDGSTLRIETGLLRRDMRQLPAARIQAVDVVRPFLARAFGLAELRIRLAGSGRTDGRLAYLEEAEAEALRARLLALHHGLDEATAEPAERPLFTVSTAAVIASVVLSSYGVTLAVAVVVLIALTFTAPAAAAGFGAASAAWIVSLATVAWRRLNTEYGFAVADAPDGLRLRAGLLETTAETIPRGRIQALRLIEPLLWRPLGWCRLEADLAGSAAGSRRRRGSVSISRSLLPVGAKEDAGMLLRHLLGDDLPATSPPPRRARLKTPLRFHFLRAGHDTHIATAVSGRIRRVTCYVPLDKVQSLRRVEGPVQRMLHLVTIHLDSAGRGAHAAFRDRDRPEADTSLAQLTLLCSQARSGRAAGQSAAAPAERS